MNPRMKKLQKFYCFCQAAARPNNFTYINSGNRLTTEFYLDNSNKVVFPDNYNGVPVTVVGSTTFIQNLKVDGVITQNYDLEQVTIPEGIERIE